VLDSFLLFLPHLEFAAFQLAMTALFFYFLFRFLKDHFRK
jgi:hypothetical protein